MNDPIPHQGHTAYIINCRNRRSAGGTIFHSWESVIGTLVGLLPVLIAPEVYIRKTAGF